MRAPVLTIATAIFAPITVYMSDPASGLLTCYMQIYMKWWKGGAAVPGVWGCFVQTDSSSMGVACLLYVQTTVCADINSSLNLQLCSM